jgi:hypothetical protein
MPGSSKKEFAISSIIIVLSLLLGFGLGYTFGKNENRAEIIIEQNRG